MISAKLHLRVHAITAMLAGLSLASPAMAAAQAAALPTDKWVSEWAETECALARRIPGDPEITLLLRSGGDLRSGYLEVSRSDWSSNPARGYPPGELVLHPAGRSLAGHLSPRRARIGQFVRFTTGEIDLLTPLASGSQIELRSAGRPVLATPIPQSSQAVAALEACMADLQKRWGLDPTRLETLRRLPDLPDGHAPIVVASDYPDSAIRAGEQGKVTYRYTVAADGRVTDCTVIVSSKSASLDRQTCIAQSKARYTPALDAAGNPVEVTLIDTMVWALQDL